MHTCNSFVITCFTAWPQRWASLPAGSSQPGNEEEEEKEIHKIRRSQLHFCQVSGLTGHSDTLLNSLVRRTF